MVRKLALMLCLLLPAAAQAQDKNPSFTLVNKSGQPIREFFATPAGNTNWGQNRLEKGTVAPGASVAVRLRVSDGCVMDLRAIYANSTREERREVNTCAAEDITFTGAARAASAAPGPATGKPANDPSFRLVNHDRQAIAEITTNAAGQPRSPNLLTSGALPPDAAITIKPPAGSGCTLELRVVFADKSAKTRTTDLCRMTELTVP